VDRSLTENQLGQEIHIIKRTNYFFVSVNHLLSNHINSEMFGFYVSY